MLDTLSPTVGEAAAVVLLDEKYLERRMWKDMTVSEPLYLALLSLLRDTRNFKFRCRKVRRE